MRPGRKMVQLGKKMVQSGKNETCDSRPGAPEGPGRKKRRSPRLDAPGGLQRSMRGPRPGAPGVQGRKKLCSPRLSAPGGPGRRMHGPRPGALGGPGRRMCGPTPGAPEGPGRKKMCNPRLAHPGLRWRPRMEQGIKTDHPWIYLNNNYIRLELIHYYARSCPFYNV